MACYSLQVNTELIDIDRYLSNRLRCISVDKRACILRMPGNLCDGLQRSDLVLRMNDRDKSRVFPHCLLYGGRIDAAIGTGSDVPDRMACALEQCAAGLGCGMLDIRGHHRAPLAVYGGAATNSEVG